jgi:DNA-binding Xre family transcriptional regulator
MLDPWKVTKLMHVRGLGKLSDLADAAGVTVGALSSVLSYRRASVSVERLAVALECDVADLVSDDAERDANRLRLREWIAGGRRAVVVSP